MNEDRLQGLRARLAELDQAPLTAHPDVLDEVHRGLVSALDDLAVSQAEPRTGDGT